MSSLMKRVIETLGHIYRKENYEELERCINQCSKKDYYCIARELYNNRVLEVAEYNIKKISNGPIKYKALLDEILKLEKYTLGREAINSIEDIINTDDILFIKGSIILNLYPEGIKRCQNDLDIIIKDFGKLWEILKDTSSKYKKSKMKIIFDNQLNAYGSIDLEPINDNKLPSLDVHVGGFNIWGSAFLKIDGWKNIRKFKNVNSLSPEDMIILVAAHSATQWFYRMRDINDMYVIISTYQDKLDWEYINNSVKDECIEFVLDALLLETAEIYKEDIKIPMIFRKRTILNNIYKEKCFGRFTRRYGVIGQLDFCMRRYYKELGLIRGVYNSLKNSKNLIFYNNRAFCASHKKFVRKVQINDLIVLKNFNLEVNESNKDSIDVKSFRDKDGMKIKSFETRVGKWIQTNYFGELKVNHE